MGHDKIDVGIVGKETNIVAVSSHPVLSLAINREDTAAGLGIARNGRSCA